MSPSHSRIAHRIGMLLLPGFNSMAAQAFIDPFRAANYLRLDRARGLVTQTEMPMMDIAALCGFNHAEQFSRAYVQRFDLSPTRDRIEGRIPFQFRNFTAHAGYYSID